MVTLITIVVAILGIAYTVINSFVLWGSVGLKMKGFMSAETKGKLILNNVILYLILIVAIAYYISEFSKATEKSEKIFLAFLIIIMVVAFLFAIILMIFNHVKRNYDVYYVISNKLYKLKHIENDILFLVSMTPKEEILLERKNFLFEHEHELLNTDDFNAKKKEMPDLFKDI
ncbi:TPA_asm: hypothetical protein GYZ54_14290 [Listeria monocytogenes]|nr:hypothetical protein [Listeria monocytogenes]